MAAQAALPAATGRGSRLTRQRTRAAWLFVAPMLLVLAAVAGWPLLRTIWFAFTDANLADLASWQFVGLTNFVYLLTDPDWWGAVRNTMLFTAVSVSIETVLGLGIALALNAHFRGRGLLRAAVLIPWAIPTVVSAQMWSWMFNDVFGIINVILQKLHLIAQPIAWTASPDTALAAVIIVDVWKTTPFMALLLLAGLALVPEDLGRAAAIDGAGSWQRLVRVTLPVMKPAILVALLFRTLDAFRIFDTIFIMTNGAQDTQSVSILGYQQLISRLNLGLGSAVSVLIFICVLFIAVFFVKFLGARQPDGGRA